MVVQCFLPERNSVTYIELSLSRLHWRAQRQTTSQGLSDLFKQFRESLHSSMKVHTGRPVLNLHGNFKYTARCNAHLDLSFCMLHSVQFLCYMQAHFKLSDVSHLKEETFIQKTPNVSKRNLVNAKNKSFKFYKGSNN